MHVTKKNLSRRILLRGLGVSLAVPPFDFTESAQTPLRKMPAVPRILLKGETPEGKRINRIGAIVRNIMLTGYPNPGRAGCQGQRSIEDLADYAGDFQELRKQEHYRHVMHCSPCYRQYLDARRELSALDAGTAAPRRMQKEIARRLDKLEKTMKSLKNLSA